MRSDIQFNPSFSIMTIRIKASKTDPFRVGTTIRIAATFDALCPVGAMRNYLALSPSYPGPLFQFSDGKFLTRNAIHKLLISALPARLNDPHSGKMGKRLLFKILENSRS